MEPQTATPPTRLRAAYDYLKSEDVTVPENYEDFEAGVQEPERLQKLYDYFKSKDVTVPDKYDDFASAMLEGISKKKESAMPPAAGSAPTDVAPDGLPQVPGLAQALSGTGLPDQEFVEQPKVLAPDFTGPLEQGTYSKRDDVGTPAEGTQYVDPATRPVAPPTAEAPDVADDGFWATLGKQLSNLPATLEGVAGNVADYFGDVSEMQSQGLATLGKSIAGATGDKKAEAAFDPYTVDKPLSSDKITDKAGDFLRDNAKEHTTLTSRAAQISVLENPANPAAWGNLLGQGVNSIAAVGAASLAGGPTAGIAAGAALGVSSTKDAAKQAGLSDKEAALTATVLAPIQGVLEEMGMDFITKAPGVNKLITSQIIRRALAYGEGKLARTGIVKAASELLPEVVKRVGGRAAVGAAGEGVTELAQGEAEGAAKLIADAQRPAGEPGYGISAADALIKQPVEQAVGGMLLGGLGGGIAGAVQGNSQSAEAQAESLPVSEEPIDERVFSVRRPTGQVEMENVRVHQVSADGQTATVRGLDSQGAAVEREVPTADLREDANKRNQRRAEAPLSQEQPTPAAAEPRTITLPKPDGSPNFLIDVDANNQPTRLYTPDGRDFPLSILETNPAAAQEVAQAIAAQQPDANVGQSPAPDPSLIDVTDQAPEPLAPESLPANTTPADAGPEGVTAAEPSPVEAPVPPASPSPAEAGPVAAAANAETATLPVSGPARYHGTSAKFDLGFSHDLDQSRNLYGKGFYTTDNRAVADGYTKKGKGTEPTVYSVEWVGDAPAKLLNLDEPLPADALQAIEQAMPDAEFDAQAPGTKVYEQLKAHMHESGLLSSDANDVYDGIADNLSRLGYDGVQHQGGDRYQKGSPDHDVHIYFHPLNELTGQPNLKITELPASEQSPPLPPAASADAIADLPGTADRSSMTRLLADDTQPLALKEKVRDTGLDKYDPKSLAETSTAVDDYMGRNTLADAYTEAISDSDNLTGDVRTALRVRVLREVNTQLSTAVERGDTAAADQYLDQAYKVADALAKRGTEAGREINAYKLLVQHSPEAAVLKTQKDVAAQREQAEKKLGTRAKKESAAIRKAKAEALADALATPSVRAAKEKVAGKQQLTKKEEIATIRAERKTLFDQLRGLTSNLNITPQQQAIAELHVKIFRSYLKEGITRIESLVERFKKDAGTKAGATDAELRKRAAAAKGDHDEAIKQGTSELGTTLDKIAREALSDVKGMGKTLAERFVEGAGLPEAEARRYAQAIEAEFDKRVSAARQRRLDELERRATATPQKRATQDQLAKTRELFNLSPADDEAIVEHLKRVTELPTLTAEDVAELRGLAQRIQDAPTGFQKDGAVEKLLKRQAQIKGINWADIASSLWYANVLSGYKTHVINLTANVVQSAAELGVSTIHAVGSGRGRYASASAKGLAVGIGRGLREAGSVLATGRETSRTPDKFEVPGILEYVRFAGGRVNPANYLKYVNRALRAGDVLFSSGLKEMRAYEQAVTDALEDAKSDGTPGQDIWARAAEKLYNTKQRLAQARQQAESEGLTGNDLERRIYEITEQSRDAKLTEQAREYGTRAVFNGEVAGGLGYVASAIQRFSEDFQVRGFKPAKYVVPFTRVITNVANAYLDYTPVGVIRAAKGSHIFGKAESAIQRQFSAEERQKIAIKAVIGAATMAGAFALSNNADDEDKPTLEITGAGTGNPTQDAQLRTEGWQPYSIKVAGKWFSYANTPTGIMLAVVGNINDGKKYRGELIDSDQDVANAVFANSFRALQFTLDMTALRGAADFLGIINSRNPVQLSNWAERLAAGSVKGYVPWSAMLTQLAKDGEMLDGQSRKQGRSFGQMLYQDIPVARNGLNDALDALGDPIAIDTDRLISAPPHRDASTQRIWNWMDKNNLFVPVPNRNSGGALLLKIHGGKEQPMTDDEYYRFMKRKGQLLKAAIQTNLSELEGKSPEKAKKWLLKHSSRLNTVAKEQVFGPNTVQFGDRAPVANANE